MKWIFGTAMIFFGIAVFGLDGNLALNCRASDSRGRRVTALTNGDRTAKTGGEWGIYPKKEELAWLLFDFGKKEKFGSVIIQWHSQFAKEYALQISDDAKTFRIVLEKNNGKGRLEAFGFPTAEGRFLRLLLKKPGTKFNGFFIHEVEIYRD